MYYISNWRDMNDLINGSRNVAYPIVVSPMISIKFYPPNLLQGIPCRKTTEDQIVLIVALTENYPNTRDKVEQVKEPKQSW